METVERKKPGFFLDFIAFVFPFLEYIGQEKHVCRAPIVEKQHQPFDRFWMQGPVPGPAVSVKVPEAWYFEVKIPHGKAYVKVSKHLYDLMHIGDNIGVRYQIGRITGKLRARRVS